MTLRRIRARTVRHAQAAWLVVSAVVAGTVLLLDKGFYALGAVALALSAVMTWLAGIWVVPRGVDAYQRRATRALRDWRATASQAWDRAAAERARIATRVARLDAPPILADEHRLVVHLLTESDRLRTDRSLTVAERFRRATEARQELRALTARVTEQATENDERRYADAFAAALEDRDHVYRKATREVEAASERALAALTRMRVPAEWSATHSEIARRFESYLDASRRLHAVVDGASSAEAEAAGAAFERAQSELFDFLREESREFVAYWRGLGAPGPEAMDAEDR